MTTEKLPVASEALDDELLQERFDWSLVEHPEYLNNPFCVGGDSYSGIAVPIVTQVISDGIDAGVNPWIDRKGYILGNPETIIPDQDNYEIPFAHACVIDYGGSWVELLPLVFSAYNNNYHSSIGMTPFKALYGRRCRYHIVWFELGEVDMFGPNLVYQAIEKVKVVWDRLKAAQSHQKSYVDVRHRYLEFEVKDRVFLKVSPMKRVVQFGKKGKLSHRFIGRYVILRRAGDTSHPMGYFPSRMATRTGALSIGRAEPILPMGVLGCQSYTTQDNHCIQGLGSGHNNLGIRARSMVLGIYEVASIRVLLMGSMSVREYSLKFTQLARYAQPMVANFRARMSKFVLGVLRDVVKKYRTTMLVKDMDVSRLMVHAQQIQEKKLK
ncbi:hypothetical protein FXO38_06466 [Capsicum annuum]|nr:hypothetical protein FXO38_06466 [Capsicum annuum]